MAVGLILIERSLRPLAMSVTDLQPPLQFIDFLLVFLALLGELVFQPSDFTNEDIVTRLLLVSLFQGLPEFFVLPFQIAIFRGCLID